MYKWYALKRILRGVVIYVILIFLFSLLFNKVSEETTENMIFDQIQAEARGLKTTTAEEYLKWRQTRKAELYHQYKLDRPFAERVVSNAINIITFRFGTSTIIKSGTGSQKVMDILMEALPRTILLFTLAAVFQTIIGLWLGLKKAQKPGGKLDKSTSIVTLILQGMPVWWVGLLFILFFSYTLKLFPSGGLSSVQRPEGFMFVIDRMWHMCLPIMTLVLLIFWSNSFVIRNLVVGTLQEDFIMSARARGIPERKVLFGHTIRTAAPPIVTIIILRLIVSMSGSMIFEGIFSWPGLGNLYWISVQQNDIPVLMGNLALTTGMYQIGLIFLDLIYGFLDPRVKVGGKA
ncbi:MAG: peptide ABC transporter permease [Treponema sp.]|nr:MAG: peptide ABC transporter permease [Treponema sp.]